MNLDFVAEVWDALRSHIEPSDRSDAADTLTNLLIDHNYEAEDIKEAFRGDKDLLKALSGYMKEHEIDEEDEDEDEYEED